MSAPMIKQLPLKFRAASKNDVRSQFAALCYRMKASRCEVLLITSRRTGRWIIPKGWPEDGLTPADSPRSSFTIGLAAWLAVQKPF